MKKIILLSVLAFNVFSCKDKEEPKPAVEEIVKKELVQVQSNTSEEEEEGEDPINDKINDAVANSPKNGSTGTTTSGSTTIVKANSNTSSSTNGNTTGGVTSTGSTSFVNTSNSTNSSSTPSTPKVETKIIKSSSNKELTVTTDQYLGFGIADMYFNLEEEVKTEKADLEAKTKRYEALKAERQKYDKLANEYMNKMYAADQKVTELYNLSKAKYNEINSLVWDASNNAAGFDWNNYHPTKARLEKEKEDLDNQRMPFLQQRKDFEKKYRDNEAIANKFISDIITLEIQLNNENIHHGAKVKRLNDMIAEYGIVVK
ncbi:hypothetical protein [Flammeovirga kamogawensis]|uniref:Uncharacterized protein n=1 Tax=Flammeovirga kamogawensis TaxID=373891 RepID=A0ABX8H4M9_9BACT|nr:hypothetical protein [Flammeovirga kamogawensis]MBB6461767.1 hypothetical protein [Flammeovirga kamogawensis]QWG10683.1 hypothetical protein KM029_25200 [Flammeovirga kamogawensis]TRX63786.1 hypothetical protein EO216_25575 [Flammeovirga kamogawensis]